MLAIIVMMEMMTSVSTMLCTSDSQETECMHAHMHMANLDNNKHYCAYVSTRQLTEVPYCSNF